MFAPAVLFMSEEFHNTSDILSSLTVSIFVLGYVVGPLVLAPLSEVRNVCLCNLRASTGVDKGGCLLRFDTALLFT